jgi:hypothetical protein
MGTVAIVNNLDELGSQSIDKINSCTFTESSRKIEVIANTSQDPAQKCIANSIVDSKVPQDIKTINQVNNRDALEKTEEIRKTVNLINDQDKLAVDLNIVTKFIQGLLEELLSPDQSRQK